MKSPKSRRTWEDEILQTLKDQRCPSSLLSSTKLSITIQERKTFHNKIKYKQYLSTNPVLLRHQKKKCQSVECLTIPKKLKGINNFRAANQKRKTHTITTKYRNQKAQLIDDSHTNFLLKRQKLTDWIRKQDPSFSCIEEAHLTIKEDITQEKSMEK